MQPSRSVPQAETTRSASLPRLAGDLAIYTFIVLLGAFQFAHYPHFADFSSDVTYPDLARSLLEKGLYEIRLLPQTTLPPGLPLLLALAGKLFGLSPAVAFGVVAVSTSLGLIAAYELLRRVEGRAVAVVACLLLASSPVIFGFNTDVVFPEMPYLLASMLVLLLTLKIDRTPRGPLLVVWILLLAVALVLAVLIRSVGIALLVGLISWMAASFVMAPEKSRTRMIRFLIPLAFGLAAQLGWSMWAQHHQTVEWQLPGYPGSYISQIKVKNGHEPELGFAQVSDLPVRVERNIVTRAAGFSQLLLRRNVSKFWSSPAISGVLIIIALGLVFSLRNGGQLYDWYFLWYECIFMVWPWDYRDRFILPVVPLACLYLWRGGKTIMNFLICQPKRAGLACAVVSSLLCICSAAFAFGLAALPVHPDHVRGDHLQTIAATLFWGALAIVGLVILKLQQGGTDSFGRMVRVAGKVLPLPSRIVLVLAVTFLVGSGVKTIVAVGRNRLNPDITKQSLYPEIEASEWIRAHEPSTRVIMAREPEFVFHYSQEPTVWFPPISDPKVLMDGIQRHHVELVVVAHHPQSYWLPPEDTCFQSLQQTYPTAFHLIHRGPDNSVFQVVPSRDGS